MRLIDADAFLAREIKRCHCVPSVGSGEKDYESLKWQLQQEPTIDVAKVAHGEWVHTDKHLWYKNKDGSVDEWRLDIGFHNGPECEVCGESFCVSCDPDYEDTKCKVGHYVCSKCGGASRDGHENYCPNCGAHMDGWREDADNG